MGKFLTELSGHDMSGFLFLDDDLSKYKWIFTKACMCIDKCRDLIWDCK